METAMRNHQDACEAEFKRNALEYRDSVQAENAKETTQLQAMIDRLRSENSSLTSQRDSRTGLEFQEQKKSIREAYERTFERPQRPQSRKGEVPRGILPGIS
jgi:hypothetical protein